MTVMGGKEDRIWAHICNIIRGIRISSMGPWEVGEVISRCKEGMAVGEEGIR